MKKTNKFVSYKFGNVQFVEIMNILGGATSLDSFVTAYRTSERKGFFPNEWFDSPDKLMNQSLPSYDDFFSRLRNCNPLEKTHSGYQFLIDSGCSSETVIKKSSVRSLRSLGKIFMLIYSKYGALNICNHSGTFFAVTITKMYYPL